MLRQKKFSFCQPSVKYAGFILSVEETGADPDKVTVIAEFTVPTNITELQSFLGLVNQLGNFVTEIVHTADLTPTTSKSPKHLLMGETS